MSGLTGAVNQQMTESLTTAQGLVLGKEAGNMIAIRRNLMHEGRRYAPTAEEIRRACEEIQATWPPRERARRYRGSSGAKWTPPMIRLRDIFETLNEETAGGPA